MLIIILFQLLLILHKDKYKTNIILKSNKLI